MWDGVILGFYGAGNTIPPAGTHPKIGQEGMERGERCHNPTLLNGNSFFLEGNKMVLSLFTQFVIKLSGSVGQQLMTAACFGVVRWGWEGSQSLRLMLLQQQQGLMSFFRQQKLLTIYSRFFTFLKIILIYWACLAWIINRLWGCLSAPGLLGDLRSRLWKQFNPRKI